MKDEFYAQSRDGKPREEWQPLAEHLKNVAEMARRFAGDFHAGDWGHLAGLWRDLDKYSNASQVPFAHIEEGCKENGKREYKGDL
jgi:hypothetical protein